jgi:hypothetical protein
MITVYGMRSETVSSIVESLSSPSREVGSGAVASCGSAEQGNAVDAFGPEPVRFSDALLGLGATDCGRSALILESKQ